ncbi:hypothetical protein QTP70_034733 [Hemibagrus guttatus]|uniref:Transposase Tc1-like domain-containing protein n=1 Tax=Hemibagrus guttatus TaxID=175788 RepID=A0AAE0Q9A7_9TELE|nr:hypothetical protein QTP70_034733 [Hemibagrus guttatus]
MKSKELSLPVKQSIVKLKNENKSIREIAKTLGVAKSTIWSILKKAEHTGDLMNNHRSGRPRKTTEGEDRRILSLVKKNPFTTVGQIKNTLQEVGVSVSESTIKRRLHQSKYSWSTVSIKERKTKRRLKNSKNNAKKSGNSETTSCEQTEEGPTLPDSEEETNKEKGKNC